MAATLKFPYRYRVGILLYFLILITYLDRVTISLVGVRIKAAFHLTNTQYGYVLDAFALAYALFEIPSASMGGRLGQPCPYFSGKSLTLHIVSMRRNSLWQQCC